MSKVKIFSAHNVEEIEGEMNDFLSDGKIVEKISSSASPDTKDEYSMVNVVVVWRREE